MKQYHKILLIRIGKDIVKKTSHPRQVVPPFTLKYIQALLKESARSYNTALIDTCIDDCSFQRLIKVSKEWLPDIIVLDSSIYNIESSVNYINEIKRSLGVLTFAVGNGPNIFPERYSFTDSPVDIVLRGEPEKEICGIIEKISQGGDLFEIKAYYRERLKQGVTFFVDDISSLPFPSYSKDEVEGYKQIYPIAIYKKIKWGHILTSRGCSNKCIFCSPLTRETFGNRVRVRNTAGVVNEIEEWVRRGINVICFDDDDFTADKEHVIGVCRGILNRKIKIKWVCHARIDNVTSDMLALMKQSGCALIKFGVESGSPRVIETIGKANNGDDWIKRCFLIFKEIKKMRIPTIALFIIGNPGETKIEVLNTLNFAKKLGADLIQIHFFMPYPGSEIHRQVKGQIKNEYIDKMYHYNYPFINLSDMSTSELWGMRRRFYREYYLNRGFIIRHCLRYFTFYSLNRDIFSRLFNIRQIICNSK